MTDLLSILITLSISGSILLIFSELMTYPFKRKFTANWHYSIKKIVLLVYIAPAFLLVDFLYIFRQKQQSNYLFTYFSIKQNHLFLSTNSIRVIFTIWLLGAVITVFRFIYIYRKFIKSLRANCLSTSKEAIAQSLLEKNSNEMNLTRKINLSFCRINISPILLGVFKPMIVLPMFDIPIEELDIIIKHELTHFKKKDLWVKQAMSFAMILHWYNPFIYILQKEINKWSEFSCDEDIVINMSHLDRKKYGETILNIMGRANQTTNANLLGTTFSARQTNLKHRLLNILNAKQGNRTISTVSFVIIVLMTSLGIGSSMLINDVVPITEEENNVQTSKLLTEITESQKGPKQKETSNLDKISEDVRLLEENPTQEQTNEEDHEIEDVEQAEIDEVILVAK